MSESKSASKKTAKVMQSTKATTKDKSTKTKAKSISLPPASKGVEKDFQAYCLLNSAERDTLMQKLYEQNPNPKSELDFRNPFELLCAVVLSAQATDVSVNKVTPALFAQAPDAASLASLSEEQIGEYIKSIGLWRNKARFLSALAKELVAKHAGQVPNTYEDLIKLPGVGSKTAKVVLNVAFGLPYIAVDTHVYRVCNRTGLCLGKSASEVAERLPALISEKYLKEAHHYLLLHGRYVCTAQKFQERCETCVIKGLCKRNLSK